MWSLEGCALLKNNKYNKNCQFLTSLSIWASSDFFSSVSNFLFFLQVFMGIVCACCLPRESLTSTGAKTCRKLSILKILKIPTIWFSFTGFIVATMCNGFLSINLEPQVSKSDIYCKTGKYPLRGYLLGVRTASSALESQRLRMTT